MKQVITDVSTCFKYPFCKYEYTFEGFKFYCNHKKQYISNRINIFMNIWVKCDLKDV